MSARTKPVVVKCVLTTLVTFIIIAKENFLFKKNNCTKCGKAGYMSTFVAYKQTEYYYRRRKKVT